MAIFDPITMRPLLNDGADAELLALFHATCQVIGEAITDEESSLRLTGSVATDEHGKDALVLCVLDDDEDGPLGVTPVAILLPVHTSASQRTFSEAFNAAMVRRVESDALKRVTDRMEREEAELAIAAEINSIVIDTTATEDDA